MPRRKNRLECATPATWNSVDDDDDGDYDDKSDVVIDLWLLSLILTRVVFVEKMHLEEAHRFAEKWRLSPAQVFEKTFFCSSFRKTYKTLQTQVHIYKDCSVSSDFGYYRTYGGRMILK